MDYIINAIMAGLENGLPVAVNIESNAEKVFNSTNIYNDSSLLKYFDESEKYPIFKIMDGCFSKDGMSFLLWFWKYMDTIKKLTPERLPDQKSEDEFKNYLKLSFSKYL